MKTSKNFIKISYQKKINLRKRRTKEQHLLRKLKLLKEAKDLSNNI